MTRKFWTIVVAALFIICLASVADAQRRAKPNRGLHAGNGQSENPGNQNENPGNSNPGENPGNGNQGETPADPPNGTPDGSTPSEEPTCDDLKHGTPGLYGLCIAFCEAHDCVPELLDDHTLDFSQCKKNDRKLLDKYRDRMGEDDPDMPCVPSETGSGGPPPAGVVTCPCWNEDDLDKFRAPPIYYPSDTSLTEFEFRECGPGIEEIETSNDNYCSQAVDYRNYYNGFATADWDFPYRYWFELRAGTGSCEVAPYCARHEACMGPDCPQEFSDTWGITLEGPEYDACMADLAELETSCY